MICILPEDTCDWRIVSDWEDAGWSGQAVPPPRLPQAPQDDVNSGPLPDPVTWGSYPSSPPGVSGNPHGSRRPSSGGVHGNPYSKFNLAGWWSRAFAALLDGLIFVGIGIFVGIATGPAAYYASLACNVVYLTLLIGTGSGQTVGMRFMRIGIADANTRLYPIGVPRAFIRTVAALAMGFLFPLGVVSILWPIWDPRNQTLHDKLVGSIATVRI